MADTVDAHLLQLVVLQRNKGLTHDTVLCRRPVSVKAGRVVNEIFSPRKDPQYCSRPREVKNSTHSSAVQSEMIDRGVRGPSLE